MKEQPYRILRELGLSTTEAHIYLTGLSYKTVSPAELEKQTGIKRTTIYHALNTLIVKGLAASTSVGGVRLAFSMTAPHRLEKMLDRKLERLQTERVALQEILPFLVDRTQKHEEKLQVKRYEGIEGVKAVVDEALYCKKKHWDIIAPQKNFFSEFDPVYANHFMKTRARRGITTRALWERSVNWKKLNAEEVAIRQPRFLPDSMTGYFHSLIIIFDDTIAYITSLQNASAILVESAELSQTMKGIFDALWSVSEPYKITK